jgi:adenylate kinase
VTPGCVLVFGVSGVGKSSACRRYVADHPETLFVSASSLLKQARQQTAEALRTAAPEAIIDNQALLASAFAAYRAGREAQPILVDAHGVIDNDRDLVRLPASAIAAFRPDRLVLLEATPEETAARRDADVRPRPSRSLSAIAEEIAAERAAVEGFAAVLGLPLLRGAVGPNFRLDALLDAPAASRSAPPPTR